MLASEQQKQKDVMTKIEIPFSYVETAIIVLYILVIQELMASIVVGSGCVKFPESLFIESPLQLTFTVVLQMERIKQIQIQERKKKERC